MNKDVMLVTGAGQIGMAIARRTGFGRKIILGDKSIKNAETTAEIMNPAKIMKRANSVPSHFW